MPVIILTAVLIGGSAYLLAYTIMELVAGPRTRALGKLTGYAGIPMPQKKRVSLLGRLSAPLTRIIQPILRLPYFVNLHSQTEVLKINVDLTKLMIFKFAFALAIALLAGIFFKPLMGLAGLFIGFLVPDILIWNKVKAKKEAIVRIFPETIDLLDMCINAGADFLSAIRWVVEKSDPNPFIEQLAVVLSEIQVGKPRSTALKDMARRLALPDINSFVRTIVQSERMGTSIEESFRALSEDTRENRFRSGERYAIKASLKILFPLLFFILPAILIIVAGPIVIKFTTGELIPKNF